MPLSQTAKGDSSSRKKMFIVLVGEAMSIFKMIQKTDGSCLQDQEVIGTL